MKLFENKNLKFIIIPMITLTIITSILITIQTVNQYKQVIITVNKKMAEILGKVTNEHPEVDSKEIIEILNSDKNNKEYEQGKAELEKIWNKNTGNKFYCINRKTNQE